MSRIAFDHVEKVYSRGVKALDDLNLEVKEGEFMMLVGPSGCGKWTALRSIAGLEEIISLVVALRAARGMARRGRTGRSNRPFDHMVSVSVCAR
jgi:ABC-type Fe3+/spermidine/putrescine transport system ATPase subunit